MLLGPFGSLLICILQLHVPFVLHYDIKTKCCLVGYLGFDGSFSPALLSILMVALSTDS